MRKYLFDLLVGLIFLITFGAVITQAETVNDVFTWIRTDGGPIRGSLSYPTGGKEIIRPQFSYGSDRLLESITGPDGQPYFEEFNKSVNYVVRPGYEKNNILYYNYMGKYEGRDLSLKIQFINDKDHKYNNKVSLDSNGAINGSVTFGASSPFFSTQLVFTDTKEVVPDVLLEYPQTIRNSSGFNGNSGQTASTKIYTDNLIKVFLLRETLKQKVTESIQQDNLGEHLDLITEYGTNDPQNYLVIADNNKPLRMGIIAAFAYPPNFTLFSDEIPTVGRPRYRLPEANPIKNLEEFSASYVIDQNLLKAYDAYYPDSLKVTLKIGDSILKNSNRTVLDLFDKEDNPIDELVSVTEDTNGHLSFSLSKEQLKKLGKDTLRISINFEDLNELEIIRNYYNNETQSYWLPLSVYNETNYNGLIEQSEENTIYAEIVPSIMADTPLIEKNIGFKLEDIEPNELVENVKSTIPNDKVTVTIVEPLEFPAEGTYHVSVKLQSQKDPRLAKVVKVPLLIKNEVVTSDYFENQKWLIDSLNKTLAPKKIDHNLLFSDLIEVDSLEIANDEKYTDQHIPATIYSLRHLKELVLVDKELTGELPASIGRMKELVRIAITGNSLSGSIPISLVNLPKLTQLNLENNQYKGEIPTEFTEFKNLKEINLSNNLLVGLLPSLPYEKINISANQIYVNKQDVPDFLKQQHYEQTFIGQTNHLELVGTSLLKNIKKETIRPFNSNDPGYFDLKILNHATDKKTPLYDNHIMTIKDENEQILYTGVANPDIELPYTREKEYHIYLDGGPENPNVHFLIKSVVPELKFSEIPKTITFKQSLSGKKAKLIDMEGELSVYDSREEQAWELSLITSPLIDNESGKELKGEFIYLYPNKNSIAVPVGEKTVIMKGVSDFENPLVPISSQWQDEIGLNYRAFPTNYLGNYRGTLTWHLEDAPR